jgi:putative transposase
LRTALVGERRAKKVAESVGISLAARHSVIAAYREEHPGASLLELCSALDVSRSWFYDRPFSLLPDEEETRLRDRIERIVLELPGYGYRRVTAELQAQGEIVNRKRVLRILREESLLCRLKKRFISTTDSNHTNGVYRNLLKERILSGINEAWVADITYIHLPAGFCYLATILDAFSRRCVGWNLSKDIDTRLCLGALDKALSDRQPTEGMIHHSDRGVQYTSGEYIKRLTDAKILPSMSAKGNPYDNAKAESFFKTLKREEVYLNDYRNFVEALSNIDRFIEAVYNRRRLHSSLGYRSPVAFEESLKEIIESSSPPELP